MNQPTQQFTAAEISRASGSISRQGVAKLLLDVPACGVRVVRGKQETPAWTFAVLPEKLCTRLEADARRQGYRNAETLLSNPPAPWTPPLLLRDIAEDDLNHAAKLRDVLTPFLREQSRPADERNALIAARYGDAFGTVITTDYARKLFQRTLDRDAGVQDFGRLELYLCDNPKRKESPSWTATASDLADALPLLESRIASVITPANPPKTMVLAVWRAAFEEYTRLVTDGVSENRAARMVRDFLHARAVFLPRQRDTLLKTWNEKLTRWLAREGMPGALADLRCQNGKRVVVNHDDVALLRWSTTNKHSGRLESAWREEYERLSEATRALGKKNGRCPRVVVRACNRELLNGLFARRQGARYLDKLLGSIVRNVENVPSMHAWVMDDLTCNLEVALTGDDGQTSLCQPQLIVVMDIRSGKYVGWAASADKSPTGDLVAEAFCDAVRRTQKVSHHLFLENGKVFGGAGQVVGKYDDYGAVVVSGLAEYGCKIHHFTPGSPTSKGELEKSFDLLQRLFERHPGYTGREQRHDAPDKFRREQIEMRRKNNPRDPATCRYTFEEGIRAIAKMIDEYNATPQHGRLKGLSPNQAFDRFQDHENPAIDLPPNLWWLLNPHERVVVKISGVKLRRRDPQGVPLRVRGGRLADKDIIGREFWAVTDRRNPDSVTFMSLNFATVFTEPLRPVVELDESETAPESGALKTEFETKAAHRRVINDEYQGLISRFGDPRAELLSEAQQETARRDAEPQSHDGSRFGIDPSKTTTVSFSYEMSDGTKEGASSRMPQIDPNLTTAAEQGEQQRAAVRKRPAKAANESVNVRPGFNEAAKSIFGKPNSEGKAS